MKLFLVCLSLCVLSTTVNSHPNLSTTTKQTVPSSSTSSSSTTILKTESTTTRSSSPPSSTLSSVVSSNIETNTGTSDNQSVNVTDQSKTVGAFLNFTRELLNLTSSTFNKNKNNDEPIESKILVVEEEELTPSGEEELTNDKDIQDLLRGLLDDEFGSEEDTSSHSNSHSIENDKDESEDLNLDVFHDDDDDEVTQIEEESIKTSVSDKDVVTVTDTRVTIDEEDDEGETDEKPTESNSDDLELEEDVIELKEKSIVAGENRTSRAHDDEDQIESRSSPGVADRNPRINHKSSARNKKRSEQVTVSKYNKYVDAVFKRMNAMIRGKRMDPLRVNLFAGSPKPAQTQNHQQQKNIQQQQHKKNNAAQKKNGNKNNNRNKISKLNNNNNNNKNKRGGVKKNGKNPNNNRNFNNRQRGGRPRMDDDNQHEEEEEEGQQHFEEEKTRGIRTGRSESNSTSTGKKADGKMRPVSMESTDKLSNDKSTSKSSSSSSSESKEMKTTHPKTIANGNRPTRGVLHGLSTLRRAGSVKVIRKGPGVRLVRAKFLLGPVALDILPKKSVTGTTKSSNVVAATATARSLKGILEIRLKSAGPTRIRKLRVFPPSNVRVEGETNGMKKQGYRKITPVAARRLMSVANQVIKRTENVDRNTTNKNTNKNKKTNKKNNKKNNKRRNNNNTKNNNNRNNVNNKRRNGNKKTQNRPNNSH